jgi:hypothetical protein
MLARKYSSFHSQFSEGEDIFFEKSKSKPAENSSMSAAKFWPLSSARQTLKPIYSCSMCNVSITFPKIRRKFPWETSPGKLPMKDRWRKDRLN